DEHHELAVADVEVDIADSLVAVRIHLADAIKSDFRHPDASTGGRFRNVRSVSAPNRSRWHPTTAEPKRAGRAVAATPRAARPAPRGADAARGGTAASPPPCRRR